MTFVHNGPGYHIHLYEFSTKKVRVQIQHKIPLPFLQDAGYLELKLIRPLLHPPSTQQMPEISQWTFNTCYSHTYQQPVLYFHAFDSSGTPLSIDSILNNTSILPLPLPLSELEQKSNIHYDNELLLSSIITQEHHPLLHSPFYMMHPCQTNHIIETVLQNEEKSMNNHDMQYVHYLLIWLCVTGQPFGIAPQPNEWSTLLQNLS